MVTNVKPLPRMIRVIRDQRENKDREGIRKSIVKMNAVNLINSNSLRELIISVNKIIVFTTTTCKRT